MSKAKAFGVHQRVVIDAGQITEAHGRVVGMGIWFQLAQGLAPLWLVELDAKDAGYLHRDSDGRKTGYITILAVHGDNLEPEEDRGP